MDEISKDYLRSIIDHTLLKPDATPTDIEKLCKEAIENNFFAVCVNSSYVELAKSFLKGTNIKIASVVGFPLGASSTYAKVSESEKAIKDGADEIDMVIHIGLLKAKEYAKVESDIREVVKTAANRTVKVIIETCLLTQEEKIIASTISVSAGAHFVKTSTGFSTGGATVEDVQLIRSVVPNYIGVKASGGIRDFETAVKLVKAGATRIGASKSVEIVS
ncbi:deoxyribose-phosphate aldolase [Caldisericum exile]|uniref:Deoxyribose-phosphate aldolase n=1 Tax=Caldisericum exile (strain DSM 21853 / NBRC 104410 / AZM16c01) TaxID=511051 RepID=A0A7U6GEK9_CALEA|nr:deoxyribose-phosphate aldolase [Caldisericum exile]BAL80964.1 deoxyribose-phosphate aldolase [Caldisericum exile AZM16c01]